MSTCFLPSPLQGASELVNGDQALCHMQPQSRPQSGSSEFILGWGAWSWEKERGKKLV